MATNLENVLHKVNKFVTLDPNDRQPYTQNFDEIATYLQRRMCELDSVFSRLYNGKCLGGSYADGVKVKAPNEFDLVFQFKLPCQNLASIKVISDKPGYAKININEILNVIRYQENQRNVYNMLSKMVDPNKNLILERIQSWMEGIMTRALKNPPFNFQITYRKTGPAHTLYINHKYMFSIDFVPALVFDKSSWIAGRECPKYARNSYWHVVPKPLPNDTPHNTAWITSYANFERELIFQKTSLKNALRLLKKIRDRQNITNLKSYFIKTVFLLELQKQPREFWNKPTSYVFMQMFKELLIYVENKRLPFFWDEQFNMFSKLTSNALNTMYSQLKAVYDFIEKNKGGSPELIYAKFLNQEEMTAMYNGMNITKQTMAVQEQNSWCTIM